MKKIIYQIHRKLALWLALPVILWAVSGLLHPMMANWFKPEIAKKFLMPIALDTASLLKTPAEVFADVSELHQVYRIKGLSLNTHLNTHRCSRQLLTPLLRKLLCYLNSLMKRHLQQSQPAS